MNSEELRQMPDFHLYIGYRHTSSWSLRGWLPMRKVGVPFEETLIRYRLADHKARLVEVSPTGKVPFLVHKRDGGEVKVWDSLAIGEYLAELFPNARLWPEDPAARAFARSVSAEMHSGFRPLREHLSMALLEHHPRPKNTEADADIARVEAIWRECRERWGAMGEGPYLFGHFTIADAMYAPIVSRFHTYGVTLDPAGTAYMAAMLADPDISAWFEQAKRDPEPEPLPG
jgi:glutathione S-transferase